MDNFTPDFAFLERQLKELTQRQCEILYWVCRGMTYKEIARVISYGQDLVQAEMSQVYRTLGLSKFSRDDRRRLLVLTICPLHTKRISDPEHDCARQVIEIGEPKPDPEMLPLVKQDEQAGLIPLPLALQTTPSREIQTRFPPTNPTSASVSLLPWALALLFGFLFLVTLVVLVEFLVLLPQTSPAVSMGNTTEPTALNTPVATQVIPTRLPPSPPTAVAPTPQPTIPVPTLTRTITPQPQPTAIPTQSVVLPFKDTFSKTYRPEWQVLKGKPIIVNGRLTVADAELTMEIGGDWTRYTVDFDYSGVGPIGPDMWLIIAKKLRFTMITREGLWEEFKNDQWVRIAPSKAVNASGHLRLVVDGNNYRIFQDGVILNEITYGAPLSGPFSFTFMNGIYVSNFSVTSP